MLLMAVKTSGNNWFRSAAASLTKVHFFFAFAYALNIIISDSWNLVPPEALKQRWNVAAAMLIVTTIVWYLIRSTQKGSGYYRNFIYALILLDIAVAAFTVYTQRGMASRGVALFAIPIAVSAILASTTALFATAALCTASYMLAAIRYFIDNPSEGYKVELYGEISFYCLIFFILAGILAVLVRPKNSRT